MNGREMIDSDQPFFLSFSTRTNKQRSKIAREDLREKKKKKECWIKPQPVQKW